MQCMHELDFFLLIRGFQVLGLFEMCRIKVTVTFMLVHNFESETGKSSVRENFLVKLFSGDPGSIISSCLF